jgi:hypothetical protein
MFRCLLAVVFLPLAGCATDQRGLHWPTPPLQEAPSERRAWFPVVPDCPPLAVQSSSSALDGESGDMVAKQLGPFVEACGKWRPLRVSAVKVGEIRQRMTGASSSSTI